MSKKGFSHERGYEGDTNDWITPRWVIAAFGDGFFDLDPCASLTQPWPTARAQYTVADNGLIKPWAGMVYCNPPYGPHTVTWIRKLSMHGQGIALIFARVETELWTDFIFPTAAAYLFPFGRLSFCRPDGTPAKQSGAPSALIAWGDRASRSLLEVCMSGKISGSYFDKALCTPWMLRTDAVPELAMRSA